MRLYDGDIAKIEFFHKVYYTTYSIFCITYPNWGYLSR